MVTPGNGTGFIARIQNYHDYQDYRAFQSRVTTYDADTKIVSRANAEAGDLGLE